MKKLVILAAVLASANVYATRARVNALGAPAHLIDVETIYTNPADMLMMGDFVNIEAGPTNDDNCDDASTLTVVETCAPNSNAKGQVVRSFGNSKFGLSLGNQSKNATTWGLRDPNITGIIATGGAGTTTIKNQQNPVGVSWASKFNDMLVGASLIYSNYNDKATEEKESSAGVRLGMRTGNWDAKLGVGFLNKFENPAAEYKGTAGYSAGVGYMMDSNYFYGSAEIAGAEVDNSAPPAATFADVKIDYTKYLVGINHIIKGEASNLFFGAAIAQETTKIELSAVNTERKITQLYLPVTAGVEADANSWLVLRGSITQNVILNNYKSATNGTASTEGAPALNTTAAAVGAGLKLDKLTIDGTFQTLTSKIPGTVATSRTAEDNKFVSTVGMTYMF